MNKTSFFNVINLSNGTLSELITATVRDGIITADTHKTIHDNRFIAPVSGTYRVTASFTESSGQGTYNTGTKYLRAGETLHIEVPIYKIGDWVLFDNNYETYLLEITNIDGWAIKGLVKEGTDKSFVGTIESFEKQYCKTVPKNITLDTYKLLYEKT